MSAVRLDSKPSKPRHAPTPTPRAPRQNPGITEPRAAYLSAVSAPPPLLPPHPAAPPPLIVLDLNGCRVLRQPGRTTIPRPYLSVSSPFSSAVHLPTRTIVAGSHASTRAVRAVVCSRVETLDGIGLRPAATDDDETAEELLAGIRTRENMALTKKEGTQHVETVKNLEQLWDAPGEGFGHCRTVLLNDTREKAVRNLRESFLDSTDPSSDSVPPAVQPPPDPLLRSAGRRLQRTARHGAPAHDHDPAVPRQRAALCGVHCRWRSRALVRGGRQPVGADGPARLRARGDRSQSRV